MQIAEAMFPWFQKKRSCNRSGDNFWYDRLRRDPRFQQGGGCFDHCFSPIRDNSLIASLIGSASGNDWYHGNRRPDRDKGCAAVG